MACVRDTLYAEITEIFEKENFLKVSVFFAKGEFLDGIPSEAYRAFLLKKYKKLLTSCVF